MFFGFDLKEIFLFPIKDPETRKIFYIGSAVSLLMFIVPIAPYLLIFGYCALIAKQILTNEAPRMPAWDNWGGMIGEGAKLFAIRMIFSLPIIIFTLPMIFISIGLPFIMEAGATPENDPAFLLFMSVFFISMMCLIPISLPLAVIIPAAEMHMIAKGEFSAAFKFKEWWAILRANLGGFIAAFGIYYISALALTFVVQILMATVVLACLLPILLPAVSFYIVIIMYLTVAQAYKDGVAKLATHETA